MYFVCKGCGKKIFSLTEEEDLTRKFQQETDTFINPEKQIQFENTDEYNQLEK